MGVEREHGGAGPAAQPARPARETPGADERSASPAGLADLLHHGDAATIARTVSRLQRRHGNVATTRLVRAVISRKETGLADAATVARFVGVGRTLKANWVKLATPEARSKLLTDAALAELKTLKVPEYAVSVEDLGNDSGRFSFRVWTMRIGKAPFSGPLPSDAALADLADTVFHESRHCEQWFRMARLRAGAGKTSAEIATETKLQPRIADEAFKLPLSAAGDELTEAEGWWKSVYGADAAARNKTLNDLDPLQTAFDAADQTLATVKANASSTKAQKDKAQKDRDEAFAKLQAGDKAYHALPEEADAWKVGAAVTAGVLKP
jgi:hypothetical protein